MSGIGSINQHALPWWQQAKRTVANVVTTAVAASLLGIGLLSASAPVQAAPTVIQGQNPCALFYQLQKGKRYELQKGKRYDVVKVQILGAHQGLVDVMILGLPKKVNATVNGIEVNRQKSKSEQIVCGKEAVGSLSSYDLRSLNIDAGYFQIYADGFTVGTSLQLR